MYGWDNLVHIVADDAKPDILCVLLYYSAEGCLCSRRHHIGLIQNDQFIALGKQGTCLGEIFYAVTNDINAAFVRGIKLL